jgi:NADPH-dependent 2,4-dienoyl-CoA reductase/sulfur reductase-like enzyme
MKRKLATGGLILGAAWGAYRRLSRPAPLGGNYGDAPTKIVIVGGGFGGLAAARGLVHAFGGTGRVGVALLDRMNYTTFWPMVPSIIPSDAEVRHVAHSLRRILRPLGVEFFQDEVAGVDLEARRVKTDGGITLTTTSYSPPAAAPPSSAPPAPKRTPWTSRASQRRKRTPTRTTNPPTPTDPPGTKAIPTPPEARLTWMEGVA